MSKNRASCSCVLCKSVVTVNNLTNHYNSKQCRSGHKGKYKPTPPNLNCEHCHKEHKSLKSLRSHEAACKSNPNRIPTYFEKVSYANRCNFSKPLNKKVSNQYLKAKELGLPPPIVSSDTRQKLAVATKKHFSDYFNGEHGSKNREKHSRAMKKVVMENPQSYTSSNRGRTKIIKKYGIHFQGSWELKFYEWCLNNGVVIERNYEGFEYSFHGIRTYFPDFYLPELETYVEVKGYKTDRDVAKWSYFPHKLLIIQKYEISLIDKGIYELI